MDLNYDGSNIYDSGSPLYGSGNPAQANALTTMSFYVDGSLVGSVLTTNIFADVAILGVNNLPAGGGVVNSVGDGFSFGTVDLLTQNVIPGFGLSLAINSMQVFYTGSNIAISVSGLGTVQTQNLPFLLSFDPINPITIVMSSANLSGLTTAGGFVTGFNATGTGNIAGTRGADVPEPGTLSMLGIGLLGLALGARRKMRRALNSAR